MAVALAGAQSNEPAPVRTIGARFILQESGWQLFALAAALILISVVITGRWMKRARRRAESAVQAQGADLADLNKLLAKSIATNRAILNALPDLMFTQT